MSEKRCSKEYMNYATREVTALPNCGCKTDKNAPYKAVGSDLVDHYKINEINGSSEILKKSINIS